MRWRSRAIRASSALSGPGTCQRMDVVIPASDHSPILMSLPRTTKPVRGYAISSLARLIADDQDAAVTAQGLRTGPRFAHRRTGALNASQAWRVPPAPAARASVLVIP